MVEGVVQRHNEKQWNGKVFYSFALSGQDGWYNSGVKRPPAVGTSIRFTEKKNSKGYLEVDGPIEILADGPTERADIKTLVKTASSGAGSNADYWNRKETRDIANDSARELGASRNTAIAIIDLALKHEVFTLPAKGKREEFLWTLLDKYTNRLMGKEGAGSSQGNDRETLKGSESNKSGVQEPVNNDPDNDSWN